MIRVIWHKTLSVRDIYRLQTSFSPAWIQPKSIYIVDMSFKSLNLYPKIVFKVIIFHCIRSREPYK